MKKSYTVGVLIGNANSSYTMDLMQGIYHAAEELGANLLFYLGIHSENYYHSYFGAEDRDNFDYQYNIVYDYTLFGKVDALIISYGTIVQFLEDNNTNAFLGRFRGIPYVILEEHAGHKAGISIIADNYHGMYEVVEHLVRDHGCRRITYLAGPHSNTDARERREAVYDVMKKYGIPFDESHVEYGDYSECVEPQIARLFGRIPDMDAMICANDIMADAVYKECAKRGLVVGRDIAVTGYDDCDVAESMNPPLTTVLQNVYDMGHMALESALQLILDGKARTIVMPAQVKYRSSCGCSAADKHRPGLTMDQVCGSWGTYRESAVARCVAGSLRANQSADARAAVAEYIRQILEPDFRKKENHDLILVRLERMLNCNVDQYISVYSFMKELIACINEWMSWQISHPQMPVCNCVELMEFGNQIQETIVHHIIKADKDRFSMFLQESRFLPMISRDMMSHIENDKEFYRAAMQKLGALKARNSYLYIFKEPIRHRRGDVWRCPEELYLVASQEGETVTSYGEHEYPVLTSENGFATYRGAGRYAMSIVCLFSGEMQYGILVTEIDPSSLSLFHLISMQIGNALRFHDVSRDQRQTQDALEHVVEEIKEKNEVLNFISEYDALTGILNRRGFMERAVRMNRGNPGREAVLIFADLDHLKEINDCFGHLEGDFALKQCAETMREAVGDRGIISRIGGDEFAVMAIGGEQDGEGIIARVRETNERFNAVSDKKYYVEISMGCQPIVCGEDVVISDILEKADRALYHAKEERRSSPLKKRQGRIADPGDRDTKGEPNGDTYDPD